MIWLTEHLPKIYKVSFNKEKWKEKIENINKILLHSPCDFEIKYLNELFPNSSITSAASALAL